MSMVSELRDNLTRTADEIGEAMPEAAALMREAAFVVWDLRNAGSENAQMRELCRDMFGEHRRAYYATLFTRTGASSTQMARWYDELRELGIEVD